MSYPSASELGCLTYQEALDELVSRAYQVERFKRFLRKPSLFEKLIKEGGFRFKKISIEERSIYSSGLTM